MNHSHTTELLTIHQETLEFIENNEYCYHGDIIKGLHLSYNSGSEHILYLKKNKIISNIENPPYLTII